MLSGLADASALSQASLTHPTTGGGLAPSGSALLWAQPEPGSEAPSAAAAGAIPLAVWQELGAAPRGLPQEHRLSRRLLTAAWRFLDRLHSSGAAAAAAAEAGSPLSSGMALRRPSQAGDSGSSGHLARQAASTGCASAVAGEAATGLTPPQLARLQQQRALLLLQRLLLHALLHAPPETTQQAAAQTSQLLPPLLADAAAGAEAADAAATRLQLMLAAVIQCHRGIASRAAAARQSEQLLPLQLQQRLSACEVAANAIVDAAPATFGLQPAEPQAQRGQAPRPLQDLLPLLQPRAVLSAARQQVLLLRHCSGAWEAGVALLQEQLASAALEQRQAAAAAVEDSRQCLGMLLAADRLRRAAGRQAEEEAAQLRQRQWRDLRRALTSGRGLWAEAERPEGACGGWEGVV